MTSSTLSAVWALATAGTRESAKIARPIAAKPRRLRRHRGTPESMSAENTTWRSVPHEDAFRPRGARTRGAGGGSAGAGGRRTLPAVRKRALRLDRQSRRHQVRPRLLAAMRRADGGGGVVGLAVHRFEFHGEADREHFGQRGHDLEDSRRQVVFVLGGER